MAGSEWARDIISYLLKKDGLEQLMQMNAVYNRYQTLMDKYEWYLSFEQKQRARILVADVWRTPENYASAFLSNVLMQAYRVFDSSHSLYPMILEEIHRSNPEWEKAFIADHERKMARCKVPIWRGSQ